MGYGLLDDQHNSMRVLGRNWYLSWFAQYCKELNIESANPAKLKRCLGFHNSFASKQTIVSV